MSTQDSRVCLSFLGSSVQLPSNKFARRLLLGVPLLMVAVTGARAHEFFVIDAQGGSTQVPAGSTTQVGLVGPLATIRVMNDGTETGCTTRVTATVQGNAVGFEQVIGPPAATPTTISYDTPPATFGDIIVEPINNGTALVTVRWMITRTSQTCSGSNQARFNFTVEGLTLKLTNAEADNPQSKGDPVSLATGELHDPNLLRPDLFLGGPFALTFGRYYAAFLTAAGFTGNLGNNWTHNFDVSAAVDGNTATVTLFGGRSIVFERDRGNWTLSSTEKLDHQLQDADGGGLRFLDLSATRIYTFDGAGRLTRIEDRNGNALTVTQGANSPDMVTDGLGRSLAFTYTGGKLTRVADQTGRDVEFAYTGDDLTTFTDAKGVTTTYTYTAQGDVEGLMTTSTLPDGSQLNTQTFDGDGRVDTQTDGEGNTTTFQYEQPPNDEGTAVVDPRGQVSRYVHEEGENLSGATDTAGNADASTYDANNRIVSYTDRLGNEATFTYHDPSGFPASITDFSGATWTMDYQQQAQDGFRFYVPQQLTFPDAAIEQYEYDARGNRTSATDRAGDEWTYAYDEQGQLLMLTNPLGGTGRYTPNADGSLAEAVDPDGVARTYTYDPLKRIRTIQNADGSERGLEVDDADNIVRATNELGHAVQIEYDDNDRIRTMTDPLGNARRFEYDGNSRLAGFTDRTGNRTAVDYDPVGNVSEIRNGAGEAVRYQYDGRNQLTSVADAVGTGVEYGYDDEGRLTSVTDGLGKTGTLTQDEVGRVTGLTAPGGQRIDYMYDTVGRLTSIRNPTGRLREFSYDARGNLARVDADGITTGYEFNALGELDVLIGPNGGRWLREYDGGGQQTSLTDPLGRVIEYRYDQLGRRDEIQTPLGSTNRTFDAAGRLTRNQFFDGTTYDYTYDENNMLLTTARLALQRNNESQVIDSNGILTEYDAARRIRKITHAPGKEVTYDYDARGRLTQLTDWTGGVTRFIYDAANRRTRIERPNGVATDFTYDDNDAVTGVRHAGRAVAAEVTLQRDDDGQITSATFDTPLAAQPAAGARAFTYDAAHQMNNATYDALGRLTTDGLRQYRWDGNSTLTGYDGGDGAAEFTYDGLGSRTSRTTAAGTKTHVLNYAHPLATTSIVRSEGVDQRHYLYEPDGRLLQSIEAADDSSTFYHFDHTGSTIMLTDGGGAMTDAYAVAPFGEDVQQQGDSDQPFVYHGAFGVMWERGTSLYNMRRRYYDAATGRFLTRDPILLLDPLGVNSYQFAFNQPLRFADPSGLNPYFTGWDTPGPGVAANVNQLWGDWFIVDPANAFAQGDNLVHIEAQDRNLLGDTQPNLGGVNASNNPTGYTFYGRYVFPNGSPNGQDNREPLGTAWAARYLNGGGVITKSCG